MSDKITKQLSLPLAESAVFERKGPGGRMLSYVSGEWVYQELNRIFGPFGWSFRVDDLKQEVAEESGGMWNVSYLAVGTLTFLREKDEYELVRMTNVGVGHGRARGKGDAIESASKEAVTDAMKRCAYTKGYPLGLALYDKEKRMVAPDAIVKAFHGLLDGHILPTDKLQEWIEKQKGSRFYADLKEAYQQAKQGGV